MTDRLSHLEALNVVTGQGRVHRATVVDRARGYWQTRCGMFGELKAGGWFRPVSWPKDDAREACKTCARLEAGEQK